MVVTIKSFAIPIYSLCINDHESMVYTFLRGQVEFGKKMFHSTGWKTGKHSIADEKKIEMIEAKLEFIYNIQHPFCTGCRFVWNLNWAAISMFSTEQKKMKTFKVRAVFTYTAPSTVICKIEFIRSTAEG